MTKRDKERRLSKGFSDIYAEYLLLISEIFLKYKFHICPKKGHDF